jgi:2-phospho-L-lactate transferase/gluconeogenesis factor (CofD/UPF0052 family)
MTEPGETEGYTLDDHLAAIHAHVGYELFDYVLVNRRPIDARVVAKYARRGSKPIGSSAAADGSTLGSRTKLIKRDLVWQVTDGKVRHAPSELANAILEVTRAEIALHPAFVGARSA